ncbi:ubiquinone/menaquinone biosynthesis C-methylase UbiE [Thermovibrio guaymasensis]|uniref:Ubiquinone/menaquinone biosynthesis C-methylase UbiE n=1 Tax=Thermovibrio guaymasensis TaxID=240167 RepID=A0A420W8J7_9BACT|nr:class I SAM-dependent methyltransferase [Thermovibrio guaymasensis]RKQ63598.1 ubiquinone/menaquinone biosynthesis C-methylase UbiE [Thermovibrio guaymasensis]
MGRNVFDEAARTWDEKPSRVENAQKVGSAILEFLPVSKSWRALEIGAGTGLLTFYLQPYLGEIVAVDSSRGMFEVLKEKIEKFNVKNVKPLLMDAETQLPEVKFNLIFLHMTLHHVKDVLSLFKKLRGLLLPGGFLAVGDLLKEDGTFHKDNSSVFHFGFSKKELFNYFKEAGLEPYLFEIVHKIERNGRDYPIFLGVAKTPLR